MLADLVNRHDVGMIETRGGFRFCNAGPITEANELFSVNAGVNGADALQIASDMLSMVDEILVDAGMDGESLGGNTAWLLQHAVAAAKAVVDSVQIGLSESQAQEVQP